MAVLYILLLGCGVSGLALADLLSCSTLLPNRRFPSSPIPNEQELSIDCPPLLAFFECYEKEMNGKIEDFDDSNQLFDENLGSLLIDLCDEDSKVHKDYLASIDCFKNVTDKFDSCLNHATFVYKQYKINPPEEEELEETPYDEAECFSRGHAVGCTSNEIFHSCGQLEQNTYIELVQRSRYLGKFCQSDTAYDLRTKYLSYLDLDASLRNMYERAFEYES